MREINDATLFSSNKNQNIKPAFPLFVEEEDSPKNHRIFSSNIEQYLFKRTKFETESEITSTYTSTSEGGVIENVDSTETEIKGTTEKLNAFIDESRPQTARKRLFSPRNKTNNEKKEANTSANPHGLRTSPDIFEDIISSIVIEEGSLESLLFPKKLQTKKQTHLCNVKDAMIYREVEAADINSYKRTYFHDNEGADVELKDGGHLTGMEMEERSELPFSLMSHCTLNSNQPQSYIPKNMSPAAPNSLDSPPGIKTLLFKKMYYPPKPESKGVLQPRLWCAAFESSFDKDFTPIVWSSDEENEDPNESRKGDVH